MGVGAGPRVLGAEAHVFMDTPLRDTLSREAHEFVWCQEEGSGGCAEFRSL